MTKLPTALSSVKTDITAATLFSLTFSQHCDGIWPLQFSEKSIKGIKNKFKLCHIAQKHYIFNIVWYILHKNQFVWIQFFRHFSRHHAWQTSHHSFQSTTSMLQDRSVYSLTNTYFVFLQNVLILCAIICLLCNISRNKGQRTFLWRTLRKQHYFLRFSLVCEWSARPSLDCETSVQDGRA